jgi:type VI secretion system protein ImpJ
MPNGEVYWHEGMFLRQHHFLTEHRQLLRLMQVDGKWAQHHNWGLRSIHLDTDALANFRFSVRALKARLRDGTPIEVPEDGLLPELDLKAALKGSRTVTVHLGVSALRAGQPNVPHDGAGGNTRYGLVSQELEDENLGDDRQPVTLRRLNLRLLLSTEDLAGYETVPIARVEKSERPEATPQLDESYIPPVLACDAWGVLAGEILQKIYDRVGRKIESLAGQAVSRRLKLGTGSPEAVVILAQLRELNEAYAVLANLAFVEGVHPFDAYLELCRLVGQISVFGISRRTPALPRYNHDDLGDCFYRVKNYLDDLLHAVPDPEYQERDFIGHGFRMQVSLDRDWLDESARMFIGVLSPLDADQCVKLMGRQQLDMKVGSADRIEEIYGAGDEGLTFSHVPERELPSDLPKDIDNKVLTYFQINRGQQKAEWQYVKESLKLAIRFNETMIVGSIDRKDEVTLRVGGEMPFRFKLYVLGSGGAGTPTQGARDRA